MVRVGVVSTAAVLAALSATLILSFGVSALAQPQGIERIIKVLVACAAGSAFFLVGRGIWRDLRRRPSARPKDRFEERER
jgi:orotidine-5'-phosphate decarboxylase